MVMPTAAGRGFLVSFGFDFVLPPRFRVRFVVIVPAAARTFRRAVESVSFDGLYVPITENHVLSGLMPGRTPVGWIRPDEIG